MEGLCSFEIIPNLNVVYKGLNYTTTHLPYLSCCPLIIFKTFYFIFIFKTKAYKVIIYTLCPYCKPKMVNKETLFWLNETVFVCLTKRQKH